MTDNKDVTRMSINKHTGEFVSSGTKQPPPEWIPSGWVQIAVNRWGPRWPACIYRRLNVIPWQGKPPEVQALCIKYNNYGEEIVHQTCMGCTVYKAPQGLTLSLPSDVSIDDLFKRTWRKPLHGGGEAIYKYSHPLDAFEEDELDALEERTLQLEMLTAPKPTYDPKHSSRVQNKWKIPCIHRISVPKTDVEIQDCGGCTSLYNIVCSQPEAKHFGKKLRRKLCAECPLAEEAK